MSHWLVYWILMLDNIYGGCAGLLIFSLMISVFIAIAHICWLTNNDIPYRMPLEERNKLIEELHKKIVLSIKKWIKFIIPLLGISFLGVCLIPSTKQMAAIYLIPKIAANKDIQQLPPKLSKLALEYVNQKLNLREKK